MRFTRSTNTCKSEQWPIWTSAANHCRVYNIIYASCRHHYQHSYLCEVHYVLITLWSCPDVLCAASHSRNKVLGLFSSCVPTLCCGQFFFSFVVFKKQTSSSLKFFHFFVQSIVSIPIVLAISFHKWADICESLHYNVMIILSLIQSKTGAPKKKI